MFEEETSPKKGGFLLASGVKLHKENPDTFPIPSRKEREGLDVGNVAKLIFEPKDSSAGMSERMWVTVTAVGAKAYEGTLMNKPVSGLRGLLQWGDLVKFQPQHVIDISNEDDL